MIEELKALGLTNNEAKVYAVLAKYASLSGYMLSKKSSLDRSVTYNLLSSLTLKGLVASVEKNGKKHFFVTDPENLLEELKIKQSFAERVIAEVGSLQKQQGEENESVQVFEGDMGARKFYALINELDTGEKAYTFGGNGKMVGKMEQYVKYFAKIYEKKDITMLCLLPPEYKDRDILVGLHGAKVRKGNFSMNNASGTMFGDVLVFHVYEDEAKQIVIRNKAVVNMMIEAFKMMWATGKEF